MKIAALFVLSVGAVLGQVPNPTQSKAPAPNDGNQQTPIFRVTVVSRTTKAINYHHRTGTTHIDFRGTALMPAARGEAGVESRLGSTKIETHLDRMTPPNQFGAEYMTYVLWAITPEGRAMNLGEVVLEGDHANLLSTADLQSFGLIVTAAQPACRYGGDGRAHRLLRNERILGKRKRPLIPSNPLAAYEGLHEWSWYDRAQQKTTKTPISAIEFPRIERPFDQVQGTSGLHNFG